MPYTHSFLPPDAREGRNFNIVKGTDENMARRDESIGSITTDDFTVQEGEVVRYMVSQPRANCVYKVDNNTTATVAEIVGVGTTGGETDIPAGLSFDGFNSVGVSGVGFPDAFGRGKVTVLHGAFIADLRVSHWFIDSDSDLDNGAGAVEGIRDGVGSCAYANFRTVEAGRRVIAVKPSNAYGATRAALATLPLNYTLAYGAVAAITAAEIAREGAVIGKILKVYTGDDGNQYATIKFKFSGTWI